MVVARCGRRVSFLLADGQLAEVKDEHDPAAISRPSWRAHVPLGKTFPHPSRNESFFVFSKKINIYQHDMQYS